MLDPITAVSLAGTVVQFVDFSTKLITKGYEVYQSIDGATVENRELEVVAMSLQKHIGILSRSSREISASTTGDEKALKDLFNTCQIVAKELLEGLHSIKVQGTNRKWKSVQQALKSYWSQEKIDGLEKRISRLREQIAFHLLGILSKGQFTSLEVLQKQNEGLQIQIEGDNDRVMKELKIISSIQKENWQANNEQDVLRVSTMLSDMAKGNLKFTLRRRLAHSLRYSQMQDRHSGIAEAHAETYKWLFETDGVGLGKDLRHWLRNQNGIFWVTGKPGSGKSTLMKYLSGHKVTRTILAAWAEPDKLITSHFYFWNPGVSIQKSQLGLLRTLLYEILSQCPDLISAVLPLRWQSYKLFGGDLHAWTLQELYEAFHLLRLQKNTFLKFCFFIDGLDEFDGSHTDLIKVVQSLASADNIKICASSREWNVFEDAFASCPKLLMQDVTRTDIALYAETELGQNAHFKLLTQSEPDRAPELISEIVNKASGVFLWVFLVVRSLKEGLSNADRIGDLQRRLNALPTDLENYFAYILKSTDNFYFTQATQLFRLVLEATEPLSLLTLSFCDEEDPNFAIEMDVKSFTIPEITARCEAMRRRLNSRCKGLLEIRRRGGEQWLLDDIDQRPNSVVDFLHRTVRDFLDTPTIYHQFVAVDSNTFNCYIVLLRAHVAMIKGLKIRQTKASDVRKRWNTIVVEFVVPVLCYAKQAEESTGVAQTGFLDEIDRALGVIDENEEHAGESNVRTHWSRHYYCDCHEDESQLSFLDVAVQWGLQKYVEEKFRELPMPIGNIFLVFALFKKPAHGPEELKNKPCIQLVQVILEHGADPNGSYNGWPDHDGRSIWELTLSRLSSSGSSIKRPQEWIEIVELMILHNADPSITFSGGKSPIRLLREAFPSLGPDALDKSSVMLDESLAKKNSLLTSQGMISLSSTEKVNYKRRGFLRSFFCWC